MNYYGPHKITISRISDICNILYSRCQFFMISFAVLLRIFMQIWSCFVFCVWIWPFNLKRGHCKIIWISNLVNFLQKRGKGEKRLRKREIENGKRDKSERKYLIEREYGKRDDGEGENTETKSLKAQKIFSKSINPIFHQTAQSESIFRFSASMVHAVTH